jgi:hypothetical protein
MPFADSHATGWAYDEGAAGFDERIAAALEPPCPPVRRCGAPTWNPLARAQGALRRHTA